MSQRDWAVNRTILDGRQGGSVVAAPEAATATTRIDGFTIRNGKAASGGGIYCYNSSLTIANNTITGNTADGGDATSDGGGAIYCEWSSATITENTITENNAVSAGGGIRCRYSDAIIAGNTLRANRAGRGGGIGCFACSPTVANNAVTGNTASWGGGIYYESSSGVIADNTLTANTASTGSGGGLCCVSSNPIIANNTLTGNFAVDAGAIYCQFGGPTITNTIVAFNSSGISVESSRPSLRFNCVYGNASYDYMGLTDPTGKNGNISADPVFVGWENGNCHIQPDSPCVDAGDDGVVQADWLDLDGQARIQGTHVDIGADESDGTQWPVRPPAILRVSPDGNDANDGFTWPTAKQTIQAALDAAREGDQIWVAAGTYVECLAMRNGVALYGGFAGNEVELTQRDWRANKTIVDADGRGSGVALRLCLAATTRIDGFTIRNGTGTLVGSLAYGGGIYCAASAATITNNTVTANTADAGSGIYCVQCSVTIANNTVSHNTGAGINCTDSPLTEVLNNIVMRNGTTGIYCSGGSPTLANNIIAQNDGNGIYCRYCSPTITNNTIVGHSVAGNSGIYCERSSPTVTNTIIAFNAVGMTVSSGSPTLRSNCTYGNTTQSYSGTADPTGTFGNISADPLFGDWLHGNCHIQPDSPCVDAGEDDAALPDWPDIDGQARIQGLHVDIGADESDGTTWPEPLARIIHVKPDGDDANDGSTWAAAKRTIRAGLFDAAETDQVWVAAGTYVERITLRRGVALYGGFAGNETDRAQRNWAVHRTILDGNKGGPVVISPVGAATTTRIDGFTIRNGNATSGGGIYCFSSSPTIANNMITGNTASDSGGGIYCSSSSSPAIVNNVILGNIASSSGGGIYCNASSPSIVNNTILGNTASSSGGAICCYASSPSIVNTIVALNSSGIRRADTTGNPTLRNCCVSGNAAYDFSGLPNPTGSGGNLSADPGFADPRYGDWHIQPGSPCVDAGDDSAVQPDWLDLDGQARIQGLHVDMGADESDGAVRPQTAPNVIVRVSPDGDDANDGSSWAATKRTIQAALDAASAAGGEVWVKAATYSAKITIHPFAHLYGGFNGTESAREQRNFRANVTTLDGQQAGGTVTILAGGRALGTIDGFTITNGANSGIYCYSSCPTIAHNTISLNPGTGIYCSFSSPTIVNNMITANAGGGVVCDSSSPTIVNNTIAANAASDGAGIRCTSSSPTIVNTIVAFNSSGIYRTGGGGPTLRSNCVYGNTAYNYAGMLDPGGANGNISSDPRFVERQYGDWHIQPDSPCVDVGDDDAVPGGSLDLDAQPRIQGPHVDIGADESDGTVRPEVPHRIVRVGPEGDDANDGSSWTAAKRTVQAGIDAASVAGGEVWVSAGTYSERVALPSFVHVFGGFNGTETYRNQRDFRANRTILDGQKAGPVVTANTTGYCISTIDGFTITNGEGTGTASGPCGGGVYCSRSSPLIANNTIVGNSTSGSDPRRSGLARGGGICCWYSSPMIVNNTISENTATFGGGGVYCSNSSPQIANSVIAANSATTGQGGGILCEGCCAARITNCTIAANTASAGGGGISCDSSSSPVIVNTIVAFNSSGIYAASGSTPVLRFNCVYGNTAYNYSPPPGPPGKAYGNIAADPRFAADPTTGDFHLTGPSPCINAGDPAGNYAGQTDIDGQPRVCYGRVDIGADEFLYRGPVDFDRDNDVDLTDFGFFRACFAGPNRPVPNVALCPGADLDGDADVDLADFLKFQECFNGPNHPPGC
ncbi:MAG: right-handed parallel beta-helix repeat-containing protein [Phycisphaerae bacterium]